MDASDATNLALLHALVVDHAWHFRLGLSPFPRNECRNYKVLRHSCLPIIEYTLYQQTKKPRILRRCHDLCALNWSRKDFQSLSKSFKDGTRCAVFWSRSIAVRKIFPDVVHIVTLLSMESGMIDRRSGRTVVLLRSPVPECSYSQPLDWICWPPPQLETLLGHVRRSATHEPHSHPPCPEFSSPNALFGRTSRLPFLPVKARIEPGSKHCQDINLLGHPSLPGGASSGGPRAVPPPAARLAAPLSGRDESPATLTKL